MKTQASFARARAVLAIDALTCLGAGVLMLAAAAPLSPLLGLDAGFLRLAGAALLPVAALFGWMARTSVLGPGLVGVAVVGNLGWVAGSIAVIAWMEPTLLGAAFVGAQAAVVTLLAWLEARAMA